MTVLLTLYRTKFVGLSHLSSNLKCGRKYNHGQLYVAILLRRDNIIDIFQLDLKFYVHVYGKALKPFVRDNFVNNTLYI